MIPELVQKEDILIGRKESNLKVKKQLSSLKKTQAQISDEFRSEITSFIF